MGLISFSALAATLFLTPNLVFGLSFDKQFPQTGDEQYNILRYSAQGGPWVPFHGYGISPETPDECIVDQVFLYSRHGERYPSTSKGKSIKAVVEKLKANTQTGALKFINDYEYWITDEALLETETTTGPYSGLANMFQYGVEFRNKYGVLWDGESVLPIYAGDYFRVIESAQYFGKGFFARNYSTLASVQVIPETAEVGANSLTPRMGCTKYNSSEQQEIIDSTPNTYLKKIAARLNKESPAANLTASDASNLFAACTYELNAKGFSDFCSLLKPDDWVSYDYSNSISDYYSAGVGNSLGKIISTPVTDAISDLLKTGPSSGSLFLNFLHDTDLYFMFAAIGLFTPSEDLPTTQFLVDNAYKSSEMVPMGTRFLVERLSCTDSLTGYNGTYVRFNLNDAVIPLKNCTTGPGFSCPLDSYLNYMGKRVDTTYAEACGINATTPSDLTFYWDWNVTYSDN